MRKRILATLLAVCLVLGITPEMANAVESDFTIEDGVLIKYTGSDSTVDIPSGVTKIGDRAFYACSRLTSVTIPNGVTNIGYYAFEHCSNLTTLDIPDSVITINSNAFAYCNSLASITIPSATTDIGRGAFKGCSKLISIQVASENQAYTSVDGILMTKNTDTLIAYPAAKQGPYTVPDNVTNIEDNAFEGCGGLTSVIISDGVISIGNWAFSNCSALTNATIPDTVATIGHSAFYRCNSLSSITVPSGVTNIEDSTFYECSKLTSITLPNTVVSIGTSAFHGCTLLTGLMLPSSVTTIGNTAFRNCTGLICASIPDGVTSIEGSTFYGCTGLASVIIPSSVTSIGSYAFCDCNGLTDVYYAGSAEQWNQIEIDNYGEYNSAIINATKHYNSTGPDDTPDPPTPPTPGDGSIVSLFPVNGATDVGYDAFNPPEFRITFDREINTPDGDARADVDLTASGAFAIYRTSDDQLIWKPNEYSGSNFTVEYGDKNTLIVQPTNRHTMLEPNTQYYITMGEGFVRFADGTGSPGIEKGAWGFKTKQIQESGTFCFPSADGTQDISYEYTFRDDYFSGFSDRYNHELAKMSLNLALSAFNSTNAPAHGYSAGIAGQNVKSLLQNAGFTNIDISSYNGKPTDTSIAAAFGCKTIDVGSDIYTLIAVAVRGGGYEMEWANNFRVVSTDIHLGFSMSANSVKTMLLKYIREHVIANNEIPKVKLWITGYSRGAAVANLVGGDFIDYARSGNFDSSFLLDEQDIYTYTFATPMATANSKRTSYQTIFNVVNPIDVVPKVAPTSWGYGRNGITYFLPSYETQQKVFQNHVQDVMNESIKLGGQNYVRVFHTAQGAILDTALDATEVIGADSDVSLAIQNAIAEKQIKKYSQSNTQFDKSVIDLLGIYNDIKSWSQIIGSGNVITGSIKAAWEGIKYVAKNTTNEVVGIIGMAHYPEVYLAWMNSVDDVNSLSHGTSRYLYINCPVNISVYDSSAQLVAQIIEDKIQDFAGVSVGVYIDANNQKVIVLPTDEEYRIVLTATDTGTVTYTVAEHSMDTGTTNRLVSYFEIEVNDGDILTGLVENLDDISSAKYPLYQNDNGISLDATIDQIGDEVAEYTVIVSISGNGIVAGGGSYVGGEFAKVSAAAASGETFLGWYVGSTLVSTDAEYRFLVDKDVSITAEFTRNTYTPDVPITPAPTYPIGGNKGGNSPSATYSITISTPTHGKIAASPTSASKGTAVTLTATPDSGYELTALTITNAKGNKLALTDKGGGKYAFTMPASKVTVDAVFQPVPVPEEPQVPWVNPFTDVAERTWYYDAVKYVSEEGLMNGTGSNLFSPDATTTRAMIWTILARLNGVDTSDSNPWYKRGQDWATANQITDGTAPDASITREQLITMLWRYKGSPNTTADVSRFADSGAVSEWAKDAIEWAVSTDLLQGSGGKLDPTGTATRAQVATILQRYCETLA